MFASCVDFPQSDPSNLSCPVRIFLLIWVILVTFIIINLSLPLFVYFIFASCVGFPQFYPSNFRLPVENFFPLIWVVLVAFTIINTVAIKLTPFYFIYSPPDSPVNHFRLKNEVRCRAFDALQSHGLQRPHRHCHRRADSPWCGCSPQGFWQLLPRPPRPWTEPLHRSSSKPVLQVGSWFLDSSRGRSSSPKCHCLFQGFECFCYSASLNDLINFSFKKHFSTFVPF